MIHYTGVNHLAMATNDMAKTIRFWRDILELRLVAGLGRPGYRHYFFEISAHDMIAFFEWPQVEKISAKDHGVPVRGPFAFDHVAIEVASQDDLWQVKDRLEAADIWVSEVIDHGFILSIYTFDPNNIAIEFSVPQQAIDLRKNPKMKDTHSLPEALEGPEPNPAYRLIYESTPLEQRYIYPGEGEVFKDDDRQS
jgi:catechol 2,3-dioxygenase-like lactoylglutathione lyase family enzyme